MSYSSPDKYSENQDVYYSNIAWQISFPVKGTERINRDLKQYPIRPSRGTAITENSI